MTERLSNNNDNLFTLLYNIVKQLYSQEDSFNHKCNNSNKKLKGVRKRQQDTNVRITRSR